MGRFISNVDKTELWLGDRKDGGEEISGATLQAVLALSASGAFGKVVLATGGADDPVHTLS